MKDSQKVYIRGNAKRGKEVIKILTDLGGRNIHSHTGASKDTYYYISPDGVINVAAPDGRVVFPFLREFYKEIKLPRWKPKYKERYYRINWRGAVVDDIWHDTQDERLCYEFGNCFETHDKAKEASYKVQEILNK